MKKNDSVLTIVVTQHWFDKILSGEKKEDFREIKKHWNQRLVYPQFIALSSKNLYFPPTFKNGNITSRNYNSPHQKVGFSTVMGIDFREYKYVKMVVGYKKNRDELMAIFDGIRITTPNEQTDLGKGCYYAVNVSNIISTSIDGVAKEIA